VIKWASRFLLIAIGVVVAMTMMQSKSSSRTEPRPWQVARDGFLYSAAVAPELVLSAPARSDAVPLIVPVTLALDNNTYRRQALPGAELRSSVRILQEGGSVLAEDQGVVPAKPDDILAPGGRWMRFVPVRIASGASVTGPLRLRVGMGWASADEFSVELATKGK
jgi:hypothetical protein